MEEKIKTEEFQKIMADILEGYEKLENKQDLDTYLQEKLKEYENIEFDMANIEQEARDLESNLLFLAKKITKIRQDNLEIFIDYLNDFVKTVDWDSVLPWE